MHTFQDQLHILSSDKINVNPTIRYIYICTLVHWCSHFQSRDVMDYDAQYRLATAVLIQQTQCTCSMLSWQELSCSVRFWCWKPGTSWSLLLVLMHFVKDIFISNIP